MEIPASLVKQLRDQTGAGMMECKAALQEAKGNIEEATTILRKRGMAQASKKTGRATSEGLIGSYLHMGGRIGVLVELNCESDFVARTEDFQSLLKEIALQVAAANPQYARREDVPAEILERERGIYRAQMETSGKPQPVIDKIVEGQARQLLRTDPCWWTSGDREPENNVGQLIQAGIAKLGENINVSRVVRSKSASTGGVRVALRHNLLVFPKPQTVSLNAGTLGTARITRPTNYGGNSR